MKEENNKAINDLVLKGMREGSYVNQAIESLRTKGLVEFVKPRYPNKDKAAFKYKLKRA